MRRAELENCLPEQIEGNAIRWLFLKKELQANFVTEGTIIR